MKLLLAVLLLGGAAVFVSGGTSTDPPVPRGFPGVVPAFMMRSGGDREVGAAGAGAHPATDERAAVRRDRRWLNRARPLAAAAPAWARRMYRRSLLVLRASVDPRTGAAVAGARPGWAYVWPRDAGAVAIALASAGYRDEARQIARFLLDLDLDAAARFYWDGQPVEGRAAQGDAAGWVVAAARAGRLRLGQADRERLAELAASAGAWRGRADYQEKDGGDYLGNAIASGMDPNRIGRVFGTAGALVRVAGDPDSGLDSAAAWAVQPFRQPALIPAARRTLLRLVVERESRFGLLPSEDWDGGEDPWTAPTAWTAWSLAALDERRAALRLMTDLRRASTPLDTLPERVDVRTGLPASTTPLAWSHAFAILALRELWPHAGKGRGGD